eukprot:COSAG02_NODE_323_length_24725_cov_57.558272_5_plen_147_part_00
MGGNKLPHIGRLARTDNGGTSAQGCQRVLDNQKPWPSCFESTVDQALSDSHALSGILPQVVQSLDVASWDVWADSLRKVTARPPPPQLTRDEGEIHPLGTGSNDRNQARSHFRPTSIENCWSLSSESRVVSATCTRGGVVSESIRT